MGLASYTRNVAAAERQEQHVTDTAKEKDMRASGRALAASLNWLPATPSSDAFAKRCQGLAAAFKSLQSAVAAAFAKAANSTVDENLLWLRDNAQEFSSATRQLSSELGPQVDLPVVASQERILPRILAIAEGFLAKTGTSFSERDFAAFCLAFEELNPLEYHEIGALIPALRLVLLEQIAERGERVIRDPNSGSASQITSWIRTYRFVTQTSWKDEVESLIPFDTILRDDPTKTYAAMDLESRNTYREKVANIARRSDRTETQVAQTALALAVKAHGRRFSDPRIALRESHIGYYLVGEGAAQLRQTVGFRPGLADRLPSLLRRHPDDVLLGGIAILTMAILTVSVWLLTPPSTPLSFVLIMTLVLLLPSSQAAVQLMNYLITNVLAAEPLVKMDFSKGVPDDCVTLVAIPTLLLNETQVRRLVEELEVRYLGNHDRNIHFAIVSDLPDSHQPAPEDNVLVRLCSKLIEDLNTRYAPRNNGSFFHLHRHRVYNPSERGWMGWERKRGKLHDLNQLLRGYYDSFPIKIGGLAILPTVRYVITLDSDTELPRGSAHRMIGALAHPLNQAIVSPARNIVVAGYGILQPRVGISVQCTTQSRLAALFAGETGLDPYTRAVSDVYQDLYGEGTFAGKGIYEVDTMFQVLNGRFPRNALLSHDLIEGAYARVGLATDIIVIEDYPSHYSAYNRRKHRWVRGDWQIMGWLFDRVPDESGVLGKNPLSLLSRWKIFDNLRRSLVEPSVLVLLLFSWLIAPHSLRWTIATICILCLPGCAELLMGLIRAVFTGRLQIARNAFGTFFENCFTVLVGLTLLAHQTLLSLDAIGRALVRRLITRRRLLEWETAAEAEFSDRRVSTDRYLASMPLIALGLGVLIWLIHAEALLVATPILLLWAASDAFARWLNGLPIDLAPELSPEDVKFLRRSALRIWRYFHEFSTAEHNWLVPDNIQDFPYRITATVSPTNAGVLLNARQVANELGYLTLPEMVSLSQRTLGTLDRLQKYRGHLMNWYNTRTLEAKAPLFISSVDSGNLVASLWTLEQGCLDKLRHPLLSRSLADGLIDHLRELRNLGALSRREMSRLESDLGGDDWLETVLNFPQEVLSKKPSRAKFEQDVAWFQQQALLRVKNVRGLVERYLPWKLPEFSALQEKLLEGHNSLVVENMTLERSPDLVAQLEMKIDALAQAAQNGDRSPTLRLAFLLSEARKNGNALVDALRQVSHQAHDLAEAMDFRFLIDEQRLQLSVGFEAESRQLLPYAYDLLATEPRTAVFVAIAKEDIPQDCWFRLDRPFAEDHGHPVLLSWTGTMFEYLMSPIWLRRYPNTLLDRACRAAVRAQQSYAANKGIPWGISESACARKNEAGDYHYEAFGVPTLARKKSESDPLVVSPYSTFLALPVDRKRALANLREMNELGWFGAYGFVEAADFANRRGLFGRRPELVQSWMAHHQGMSLLALGNVFRRDIVQRWFHSDRRVQATELLLQEKPAVESLGR